MLRADAMMDTAQPGFEVGKYEMNDGHELFGDLRIAPFRDGHVVVAALAEAGIAAPIICDDPGARYHRALDEAAKRFGASVRNQGKSNTACVPPGLPLVEAAGTLALSDFDGAGHEHHVVDAAALAARTAAHPGFILNSSVTPIPKPDKADASQETKAVSVWPR